MTLRERFNNLTPKQKKGLVWTVVSLLVLVIAVTGYNQRSNKRDGQQQETATGRNRNKEIYLDPDLIEKTMLKEQGREIDELQKSVAEMKKQQNEKLPEKKEDNNTKLPTIPNAEQITGSSTTLLPGGKPLLDEQGKQQYNANGTPLFDNRAAVSGSRNMGPDPQGRGGRGQQNEKKIVGKIAVISNQPAVPLKDKDDKKKGRTVYLPPSFMEASLLTGFDAATSSAGRNGTSEPLLLRIQTPAVLPNDIKADLAGCFVIAEAVGRLDKERADVRLVSLSCLSNEGSAVIDTPIKGFVTDSDSKVGLSGRVVSRMGATTARAIMAGFFEGAGDALKAAATTTTTSTLTGGTTSSVDTSQIAKYAIGGGFSEGAHSLSEFYMNLAKQTTPVIEVAATKKVTVIVSEGKELEIKDKREEAL
jgi:conjugal transfer pilus assembly protein TraB